MVNTKANVGDDVIAYANSTYVDNMVKGLGW